VAVTTARRSKIVHGCRKDTLFLNSLCSIHPRIVSASSQRSAGANDVPVETKSDRWF
jgi:hypothetical protein